MPDDKNVGDASNSVPAPLLSSLLVAVGRKEAGQNHDEVGNNSHDGVSAINTRQETEVGQQERRGNGPVDVPSKVDLAADVMIRVGDFVVVGLDLDAVQIGTVAGSHAEVGQSCRNGNERGDDMVEALRHRDVPGQQGEEARGYKHDDKNNP